MHLYLIRFAILLALFPTQLLAQNGPQNKGPKGLPPGVTREQMWPAPTAEDWKKPCLITFQRSYEDALSVSKETGKPILICVSMDGEIASEHYAGIRYRQPEIAKLYEPYVCVIASVYRHTPKDYDEQGRRILCPRFGSVTCGEHIAIEPGLFEKYFDGKRVAPRHIGVELDSKEMYDVYYAWDTDSVFQSIREGSANRPTPPIVVRGDKPMIERVASRDIEDRKAVEEAYQKGDRDQRRALIESALAHPDTAPTDLLRLAINDFDPEMNKLARQALAKLSATNSVDLMAEALRVPMEENERQAILVALEKMAETSPRARTVATVHRGINAHSSSVDLENWAKALKSTEPVPEAKNKSTLSSELEILDQTYSARPEDPSIPLNRAETTLALAVNPKTQLKQSRLLFLDAYRDAIEAEKLGATGWRLNAVVAITAFNLGRLEEAYKQSELAAKLVPADAQSWNAMAVLAIFVESKQKTIEKAIREKKPWSPEWLADLNAAYQVLAKHPYGTDAQIAGHYDFLRWLGAINQANQSLDEGLARFPESLALHGRLRDRSLQEKGPKGLEAVYEARLKEKDAVPILEWFAGYASMVAAEFHRRANHETEALAAYSRAIAHYELCIEKKIGNQETCDHYIALSLAGRARIAFEKGEDEQAVNELLACFTRRPDAAASQDGLNLSPVDTAKMLLSRLKKNKEPELASKLQNALNRLDPVMLELPAYERETSGTEPKRKE